LHTHVTVSRLAIFGTVPPAEHGATIRLSDGRALAYAEWTEGGFPAFFLHGTPGSRLLRPDESVASAHGVRLITVDRPGYGRSDPRPRRTVRDWAGDVSELADALSIDRFAVAGWSGGGAHALACGSELRHRVVAVAVAGARAPLAEMPGGENELPDRDRELLALARRDLDAVAGPMEERGSWLLELAEQPEMFFGAERPEPDRAVVHESEAGRTAPIWLREAARQGLAGYIWDWLALRLDWGFSLADVGVPVDVWHGRVDADNPASHGEFIASRVPDSRLVVWPNEAHWGVFRHWDEIVTALVERA
jgi:pimeloyl-ACP methyl ester carboxylesterase